MTGETDTLDESGELDEPKVDESEVHVLTDANFDEFIKKEGIKLI